VQRSKLSESKIRETLEKPSKAVNQTGVKLPQLKFFAHGIRLTLDSFADFSHKEAQKAQKIAEPI
jgi:hypothetical protein